MRLSGFTVDPDSLIARRGPGPTIRSFAGSWAAGAANVREVGHLDAGAVSAAFRFGERCDSGVAAVAALSTVVERLVTGAGHRYAETDAEVGRATR